MSPAALLSSLRADPGNVALRLVYADSLAESGDELGAILQRIIAEPAEDRWRLQFASELERTAGTVECRLCKGKFDEIRGVWGCKVCHGTGRVSDGRAEWAEIIRVQCELAKHPHEKNIRTNDYDARDGISPEWKRGFDLQDRERELWPAVREWFVKFFSGIDFLLKPFWPQESQIIPVVLISRGFPAVVRCTLAEWMGGECERCGGTGEGGPTIRCPSCVDGRTHGIGPRLAQAWPIERVEVVDAEPAQSNAYLGKWRWYTDARNRREVIPEGVYQLLEGSAPDGENQPYWDSESAARAALSDALIAWARRKQNDP